MPITPPTNMKNPNAEALFDSSTDCMHSIIKDVTIIPSAKPKVMTYNTIRA